MLDATLLLLQPATGEGTQPAPDGGLTTMLLYGVGIFAIFYFMLIRPQRRENDRREKMITALKKHDWVVTHAGIIGQVVEVADDVITLKIDDNQNVRVRFRRQAIAGLLEGTAGKDGKKGPDGKSDSAAEAGSAGRAAR